MALLRFLTPVPAPPTPTTPRAIQVATEKHIHQVPAQSTKMGAKNSSIKDEFSAFKDGPTTRRTTPRPNRPTSPHAPARSLLVPRSRPRSRASPHGASCAVASAARLPPHELTRPLACGRRLGRVAALLGCAAGQTQIAQTRERHETAAKRPRYGDTAVAFKNAEAIQKQYSASDLDFGLNATEARS